MSLVDCSHRWQATRINSADRTSGTSSDFYIYSSAEDFYGEYGLVTAIIPVAFYNVNSNNNVIYFNENSTNKQATLSSGFYTDTTLAAAVASAMTTASSGFNTFTASVSGTTEKMTISAGSNFSFKFGTNTTTSAAAVMGFSNTDTTAATSQTSDNIVNLAQTLTFNILISGVTGTSTTSGNGASFVVPITANSMGVVVYDGKKHMQRVTFSKPVKNLRVQLVDDSQQTLSMNGVNWSMTLLKQKEYVKG